MEPEAANNMEDSSLFMQWAMDTLMQEEEPAVVDDDVHWPMDTLPQQEEEPAVDDGEAVVFPSLQALRDASHAAEMVRELMAVAAAAETHDAANSWSSGGSGSGSGSGDGGEVTDGGSSGATDPAAPAATDYYGGSCRQPQSPNSPFARAPPPQPPSGNGNSNTSLPTVSWNFVTGSAQPSSDVVLEEATVPARTPELAQRPRKSPPPPPRRTHPIRIRSMGAPLSASCTPDHIVAERKRREKINKRLIELSTVIPGLKKMDKATILSDAAKYVKELQQRLKALEQAAAGAGSIRSKAPPPATDENNGGSLSPTSASSSSGTPPALPEIEARFSERSVMVRIHCGGGRGVAAAALGVVEGFGLTVVHANVMPFSACTIVIAITAEIDGRRRLSLTTEQIVGNLKSALSHHQSSCKDTEETEN